MCQPQKALAPLVFALLLPSWGRPAPKYFGGDEKAKYVTCAFDVWAAVDSLGFASLNINAASKDCKSQETNADKTVCTEDITGVLGAFADVASFLSSSASDCAKELNNKAYCSADSAGLVSALVAIGNSGAMMHDYCRESNVSALQTELSGSAPARLLGEYVALHHDAADANRSVPESSKIGRLAKLPVSPVVRQEVDLNTWQQVNAANQAKAARDAEIAECVFDVTFVCQLLGRAGLAIHSAVKVNGEAGKKVCTVDLAGVIGSFVAVGQFLSMAVVKCPEKEVNDRAASCSSAIFEVISAIDALAAVGASFPLTCGGEGEEIHYDDFILP
eukprot:TRINITY_DN24153_c0_g1_i2.p1 TRINITY_DN24153_c0_g1~~TRINITY_DN24153_c0_g1_i2.p1  ORF type:complete len:332 (-),score=63.48 TRINITY_DN24153_c0_g1_i2:62-1057(-)